ncbi:hypothetical protein HPG69_012995 [Diceros bicornis minor]|uniref:Uncharacterized protein n=1 Tax=Diceros bicornis minor TaxID=77932 RepID=A0A7J7F1H4_DICBM|nr:hypothetical protein HPG69_012995 [Diceros bicornis minor]
MELIKRNVTSDHKKSSLSQLMKRLTDLDYFMDDGKHTVLIYEDLSKQAVDVSVALHPPDFEAPLVLFVPTIENIDCTVRMSDILVANFLAPLPGIERKTDDVSAYILKSVIFIMG